MNFIKYVFCLICFVGIQFSNVFAQHSATVQEIKWDLKITPSKVNVGDVVTINITGTVPKNQWIYTSDDPLFPCEIIFKEQNGFELVGNLITDGKPIKHYEELFESDRIFIYEKIQLHQKIKINKNITNISGKMKAQTCNDNTCLPFEGKFNIPISVSSEVVQNKDTVKEDSKDTVPSTKAAGIKTDNSKNITPPSKSSASEESLLWFILMAMFYGFIAIFTPCVFPMIPMTVSFFIRSAAKDEEEKKKAKRQGVRSAMIFGILVILIYTIPGAIISSVSGPDFNNWLSTHWAPNIFFFIVFVIFGVSFLGWFEIVLPSGFVNKVDSKSSKDSFIGLFFMAFTLVLVSFSCTGPFVSSLLIESSTGNILKPVLGMFFFSLAVALPFVLFAIFPSMMHSLPKSGGWLNAVKVSFGFFEIAFAFKFLSIPDQTYHWGILSRDIFFAIWIVVFLLWGIYLLGKLKLPHDSDLPHIGVPRLLMAILVLAFAVYMIPGMWGAPVKLLSGITPPMQYQEFDLSHGVVRNDSTSSRKIKYSDLHKMPHGLNGFFDFKEASEESKKTGKPILIDFTGNACVNCRKMEEYVWVKPEVLKRMRDSFIVVSLYVDDRLTLPEKEWYVSKRDGETKKTLGEQNSDLQISKYNAVSQPQYIITDAEGNNILGNEFKNYDPDENIYIDFLDRGLAAYKKKINK